jgi:hypothetical protein
MLLQALISDATDFRFPVNVREICRQEETEGRRRRRSDSSDFRQDANPISPNSIVVICARSLAKHALPFTLQNQSRRQ